MVRRPRGVQRAVERHIVGRDIDALRRGGKGCDGAEGDAGKREDEYAKIHICQCEFAASAGVAGRQRIMKCAAGAGLKRSKVRGFRLGGGMIMLRELRAVQALSWGPASGFFEEAVGGALAQSYLSSDPMPGEADVKYLDGDFRVVRPGAFVRCAVTGVAICRSRAAHSLPRASTWRTFRLNIRYYLAAKLGPGIDDMDMNLDEFATRLNSEIVGKLVNIASRCAGFITRTSGGKLAQALADRDLYAAFVSAGDGIAQHFDSRDTAAAIRDIMALCDRANQYVDSRKPWTLAKDPKNAAEVQSVCTQALNLFRVLMIYLEPVMPSMAARACAFFQEPKWTWAAAATPLLSTSINAYEALAVRLDPKAVARLRAGNACAFRIRASEMPATAAPRTPRRWRGASVEGNLISIDDFLRVDLRVPRSWQRISSSARTNCSSCESMWANWASARFLRYPRRL